MALLFVQLVEAAHARTALGEGVVFLLFTAAIHGCESGRANGNVPEMRSGSQE